MHIEIPTTAELHDNSDVVTVHEGGVGSHNEVAINVEELLPGRRLDRVVRFCHVLGPHRVFCSVILVRHLDGHHLVRHFVLAQLDRPV